MRRRVMGTGRGHVMTVGGNMALEILNWNLRQKDTSFQTVS
jgi:hypothetical protein